MITLRIDSSQLQARLGELAAQTDRPRAMLQASGRAVARILQDHFRARDKSEPNRLGGRRTHWWARVAKTTQVSSVDDSQAVVSISEPGIGLKVTGGTIVPKIAKWLAIPARAEAHGRRPKTFTMATGIGLNFVLTGPDSAMLVEAGAQSFTRSKKTGKVKAGREVGGLVVYWLKKKVTLAADPSALPEQSALEKVAASAAEAHLASVNRGAKP